LTWSRAGVDALLKLAEFVRPAPGVIQQFADVLYWLISRFVIVGQWFTGPALVAASTFAEAAGKVVGVIGAAVDGLLKLGEFVRPAPGLIQTFTDVIWWLVSRFAEAASWMTSKALAAAVAFADGAGKSVGMIGGAVDALGKLSTFVAPLEENVSAFFRSLADFLEKMGSWSANFEADMLAATAAFAEGIGKSVAGIGSAVDALGKLVTFIAPAEENVSAFFRSLADLLEKMGSWSANFEADMFEATAAFAAGIGKSVTGIGAAVDALSKLVEFVAPAEENVSAFFRSLADLLEKMGSWSANFEQDMLEATGIFASGIQKSVAGIGAAADALGKLVDFVAPAEEGVSAFFRSLADLLEKMGSWSANFEADMLEATAAFAAGIQKSVAGIGAAADALGKLVEFEAPAGKHISAFFGALANLLTQMKQQAWSANFEVSTCSSLDRYICKPGSMRRSHHSKARSRVWQSLATSYHQRKRVCRRSSSRSANS
jgi:ABC-type transporter Mla subunit MlaD